MVCLDEKADTEKNDIHRVSGDDRMFGNGVRTSLRAKHQRGLQRSLS